MSIKMNDGDARKAGKHIRKPMAPAKRVMQSRRRKLREKASKADWE
jgi:hypothetical protein